MINQEEENEESLRAVHHWDFERTLQELSAMSQRSIYLALFHFAKQICANTETSNEKVAQVLQGMRDLQIALGDSESITQHKEQIAHNISDLIDAPARSHRRSRKCQIAKETIERAKH
jgi:hypothetical protein